MLNARLISLAAVVCALLASTLASSAAARPIDGYPAYPVATPDAGVRPIDGDPTASPDIRTSSLAGRTSTTRQDLRMPDTRDAAAGRGTFNAPLVTVVKVPQRQPAPVADGGIDWADAGIGAGTLLGTMVLVLGGTAVVARRRSLRTATAG
jgi:hypothetical protein